jgi:hypothetical protein
LDELIAANNQGIKLPNDFVINAHWLAIEGVQPAVAENPQFVTKDLQKKETIEGVTVCFYCLFKLMVAIQLYLDCF